MTRILLTCVLCAGPLLSQASSQASRESYRALYQTWRQAGPALEQDAATPGPQFAAQVKSAADAAQAFWDSRAAFVIAPPTVGAEQSQWIAQPLAHPETLLATPPEVQQLLAVAAAKVASSSSAFAADDKDPAIRQVRQALERERSALRALIDTLNAHKASVIDLGDATTLAEAQRMSVQQAQTSAASRRTQLAEHIKREASDWAAYYKNLSEAVGGAPAPALSKVVRPPADGQIRLSRYTGDWVFPNKGLFYGPQPQSVELRVQEAGGQLTGTLTARFAMPSGSRVEPTLTVEFAGPPGTTPAQSLPARASDGSRGTVELIPGSAFNLIEVNFQSEAGANRIASANFILVRQ